METQRYLLQCCSEGFNGTKVKSNPSTGISSATRKKSGNSTRLDLTQLKSTQLNLKGPFTDPSTGSSDQLIIL